MTPLLLYGALAASVLITSVISGIFGMAGGMILIGLMLAFLPLPTAMVLHGITQLASNLGRAYLWRREVEWRVIRGYLIGALAAVAFFAAARIVVSKPVAFILLGAAPLIALSLPERLVPNVERRGHSFLCGLVSITLSLTAGVSGSVTDSFFLRSGMDRRAIVATKALSQCVSHLIKSLYFAAFIPGTEKTIDAALAVLMVVCAIAGTYGSRHILEGMNEQAFRTWTRWLVIGIAVTYLGAGILLAAKTLY